MSRVSRFLEEFSFVIRIISVAADAGDDGSGGVATDFCCRSMSQCYMVDELAISTRLVSRCHISPRVNVS